MATKDEILIIKQRADLVTVVGEYLSLKKAGKNWLGLCPFHQEKTPSFTVSPDLGIYKCFGCGRSGDVISFVQEIDHLTFGEAVEKLALRTGVELSKSRERSPEFQLQQKVVVLNTQVATLWQYFLWKHPLGKPALQYLREKRQFSDNSIKQFGIGFAPKAGSVLLDSLKKKGFKAQELVQFGLAVESERGIRDKFINRIMFPVHNSSGQIIAFSGRVFAPNDDRPKYLNSPETIAFRKRYNLFGLAQAKESIRKEDQALFVEGQTDVIASAQAGVKHIVAPLGTGLTSDQLQLLGRYSKNVIFATDNDQAGFKSAIRGALEASRLGFKVFLLTLPPEFHDVDELIKHDPKQWIAATQKPVDWLEQGIIWYQKEDMPEHVAEVWPNREVLLRHLAEFISAMKDPVTQQVAKQRLHEQLDISLQSVEAMVNQRTDTSAVPSAPVESVPAHETYLGLEEHLIHCALSQPELVTTFPQVLPFISQHPYQTLLQEIIRWQEADPEGVWVQCNTDAQKVSLGALTQWLSTHMPEVAAVIQEYGLVHEPKEVTVAEYALMCKRLMKERSQYFVSALSKELARAESTQDKVEIRRLTSRINKLSSFIK